MESKNFECVNRVCRRRGVHLTIVCQKGPAKRSILQWHPECPVVRTDSDAFVHCDGQLSNVYLQIEFPLPDYGRDKLARLYGGGLQLNDDVVEAIVAKTKGVSAAFINELMRRSTQFLLQARTGTVLTAGAVDALEEMLFLGGVISQNFKRAVLTQPSVKKSAWLRYKDQESRLVKIMIMQITLLRANNEGQCAHR